MKKTFRRLTAFLLAVLITFSVPFCAQAGTTVSPFTGKSYTHSSVFNNYDLYNGIDVSSHNGDIDWNAVKKAGVDFAMIRVGFTGYTKSKHSLNYDPNYVKNINGAAAAGIPVGVYWYSQALNVSEAQAEAQMLLSAIVGKNITLPVVCDYEFAGTSDGRLDSAWADGTLNKALMTRNADAFASAVKSSGYTSAIYANKSFLTTNIDGAALSQKHLIWLAHYTTQTDYSGNYFMWQYSSSGTVSGISTRGAVDCNFLYYSTKPGKVTGLHTAARGGTGERLRIEWDAQPDADGYNVYMKKDGKYVYVASTQKTEYIFEDLVPGWEYYFRVTAYRGETSNAGYGSDELHTCAACPPMDLPSVVAMDSKTIQVDWNITNAHGYVVQWSTDPEFKTGLNSAYVVGHNSDSYTISVPGNSQNYYVRTRAWRYWENNSLVYGIWTDGIKYGENLEKVTGLYTSARGGYGEQLKISWDKQRDIDFYNIYRLVDGKYTVVATTTDTSYVFTDVVPGWEYYFKVSSVRNGVEGVLSDELHTCAACPPIETYSAEINEDGSVTVDWEKVNAHGYVVMWSTDPNFESDVNYSYVVGHESTTYTFTPNGNAEDYYVRVRAWRYWENNSLVYGIWTDGIELAEGIQLADESAQEEAVSFEQEEIVNVSEDLQTV